MKDFCIHVYAVCRNEIDFLPHFFNYYNSIADKIIIYDNQSTDGSREFIQAQPKATLCEFNSKGVLRDDIHRWIKNSVWKESKGIADWVIVSDLDELIYHHDLETFLTKSKKKHISIPAVKGFNMFSETYPLTHDLITNQARDGAYSIRFSKNILFDPNKIEEIHFAPGGHSIEPEGDVRYGVHDGLKLLHYKYIGDIEHLQKKWDRTGVEISDINVKNSWGIERKNSAEIRKRYQYVKRKAERVIHNNKMSIQRIIDWIKRDRTPYI